MREFYNMYFIVSLPILDFVYPLFFFIPPPTQINKYKLEYVIRSSIATTPVTPLSARFLTACTDWCCSQVFFFFTCFKKKLESWKHCLFFFWHKKKEHHRKKIFPPPIDIYIIAQNRWAVSLVKKKFSWKPIHSKQSTARHQKR